ncbi:hypothetical protein ABS772_25815 [Methylorubrum podarium]|uniref:Uncharacterized protein n=1 Tax=Methylorubrum podarium TaxID=200476 RepID=A0ABV1QVG8_9HYPH
MIKRTGLAILLGLGGFALGSLIARVMEQDGAGPAKVTEAPPALRHITQLPPPPAPEKIAQDKPAKDAPRLGR